jgi:hypothetical protein
VSEVSLRNAEHDFESFFGRNEDVKP